MRFVPRPRAGARGSKRRSTVRTGSSSRSPPCSLTTASTRPSRSRAAAVLLQLLGGRTPLHGDQGPAGFEQRHAPARQLVEPGHGTGGDEGRRDRRRRAPRRGLGARSPHRAPARRRPRTTTRCVAASARRGGPRGRVARWPGRRPAGRPRTPRRPAGPPGEGISHDGAVQHVTLPEAGHLARPDQPVTDSGVGEDLGEPDRERHPFAKQTSRTRRCGWH